MVGTAEPDMPTYEFSCHKCELIFEHIYQTIPKKIPKSKKCPECGKLAEKMISSGVFHMKGMPYRLGKTEVNTFYNEALRDSQERLKIENTSNPYKRYKPNINKMVSEGTARLRTPSESDASIEQAKKIGNNINNIKTQLIKKKK